MTVNQSEWQRTWTRSNVLGFFSSVLLLEALASENKVKEETNFGENQRVE